MALNDIYRVTFLQQFGLAGPEIRNVFYYKQVTDAPTGDAPFLATQFNTILLPAIRAIQNDTIQTLQIKVEDTIPGTDNSTINFTPGSTLGLRVGDCLPPFVCWAFRYNRVSTAVRNGQKRFAGVSENDQFDGVVDTALNPALASLATLLQTDLGGPPPSNAVYQPRIFRPAAPARTVPAKTFPAKLQNDFAIANVSYVRISSQNSRKFGEGA